MHTANHHHHTPTPPTPPKTPPPQARVPGLLRAQSEVDRLWARLGATRARYEASLEEQRAEAEHEVTHVRGERRAGRKGRRQRERQRRRGGGGGVLAACFG